MLQQHVHQTLREREKNESEQSIRIPPCGCGMEAGGSPNGVIKGHDTLYMVTREKLSSVQACNFEKETNYKTI